MPDIFARSKRLVLMKLQNDDLPLGVELLCNSSIMTHLGGPWSSQVAMETMKEWQESWGTNHYFYGVIRTLTDNATIGIAGISENTNPFSPGIEIAWFIKPEHQNKGYATEICRAMLETVFDTMKKETVLAEVGPGNEPARRVLRKLGFIEIGEWVHDYEYLPGMHVQSIWRLTEHDWRRFNMTHHRYPRTWKNS